MPVSHFKPNGGACPIAGNANSHCLHCGTFVTMERPTQPSRSGPSADAWDRVPPSPLGEAPSNDKLDALRAGIAKAPTWMILEVLAERGAELGEISVGKSQGCIAILATGADKRPGHSLAPDSDRDPGKPDAQISCSSEPELGSGPEEQAPN